MDEAAPEPERLEHPAPSCTEDAEGEQTSAKQSTEQSVPRVQVRNMAGDVLVSLTAGQADPMGLEELRTHVQDATGKDDCSVSLLADREVLSNSAWRAHLAANSPEPLELTLVASSLPVLDSSSPVEEQLAVVHEILGMMGERVQLHAMTHLRKLSSIEGNPPIDEVVEAGLIPLTLPFCDAVSETCPQLQYEALWAMTNVAGSHHARCLVNAGGLPIFLKGLSSPRADIRDLAVWALGNVAGDCVILRDQVIAAGVVAPLVEVMHTSLTEGLESLRRVAAWTISNVCRGRPSPALDCVRPFLPVISEVLSSYKH